MNYKVTWVIDVDADSPEEAALFSLQIQRDPNSSATIFDCKGPDGVTTRIDTEEIYHGHDGPG